MICYDNKNEASMKYFSMLIKPASSICNLKCKYCFYHDVTDNRSVTSYGIMTNATIENIVTKVFTTFNEASTIQFAFQGGEPTCAGLAYFKYFIDFVKQNKKEYHHIQYSIQTNGTLINDDWIDFFLRNDFLVGVSLDGFKLNNDKYRVDQDGNGTFTKIMDNIDKMRKVGIPINILTVLTSSLALQPHKLYQFYREHHFDYVQLIPCLPPLGQLHDEHSLNPQAFSTFYQEFFDDWYQDFKHGKYMSVTLFDNLIQMFKDRPPLQCGFLGFCRMQFVCEADGSIYPCDFYVLDEFKIGNINNDSIENMIASEVLKIFLNQKKRYSNKCTDCRYWRICYGQCKRLNLNYFDEEFCGLQEFLTNKETELVKVASYVD